jgi:dihydrofolate synthase/folylpolyglutamate synthase
MTYREAIDYLYSLTDYEKRRIEKYSPEVFGLSRVEHLVKSLGHPEGAYSAVHVAGTKGKGSTAAMIESVLRSAGYRTGLYTSPHLHTFRERIRVNGRLIERQDVVSLLEELRPLLEETEGTTTFEAVTAIALTYYARQEIDVLIAEVGLGGRLDATNVLMPEVSVITSLSLDHTHILGTTLAEIAREKGGIIKPGVSVVSAPQQDQAMAVLSEICFSRNSPLIKVGTDWQWSPGPFDLDGQSLTVERSGGQSPLAGTYRIPLLGRHQLENCATALAALQVLSERGFDVPRQAIEKGLAMVEWSGRMEILSKEPLVVADGAHNPHSAQVLRIALEEWFPNREWILVFGAFVDKDIEGMLRTLLPIAEYTIVTRSRHPRAVAPIRLADLAADIGKGAEVAVSVERAIARALTMVNEDKGLLITGSISLIGEAQEVWAELCDQSPPDNDQ